MTRAEALRIAVKYLLRAEADANTRKMTAKTDKALAAVMEEHAEIMQTIAVIEGMLAQTDGDMSSFPVVFSGGPANGKIAELPDLVPEWRVPVYNPIDANIFVTYPGQFRLRIARYRRTTCLGKDSRIIYKFEGITE